jgi:dTDP-glucose 4,6-dehydratase
VRILVTGAAGFIGSNFVRKVLTDSYPGLEGTEVVVLDALTYSGNLANLAPVADSPRYSFVKGDIRDAALLDTLYPGLDAVVHFAAESHVDRSVRDASIFVETNVVGTQRLLDAALRHDLPRFVHVSTDEVYGSISEGSWPENWPLEPNSPYSASKAGSDLLARAYHRTHGLNISITRCSNNYGPFHFPEKLIPLVIIKCLAGEPLPVYGTGSNVRDWLYVDDHVRALQTVFETGAVGNSFMVGGNSERTNLEVVHVICDTLDRIRPRADKLSYREQITFVADRPGHDFRYAIDATKLQTELGWKPLESFESGMEKTIRWYLENREWWEAIQSGEYQGERLGLKTA